MKKQNISKSSWYGLCLFLMALFLAMTPLVATAANTTVNALVDSFSPGDITINTGDTVTWNTVSTSAGIHTVTGDPAGTNGPDSQCQDNLMPAGQFLDAPGVQYMHTFNTPGLCHYVCLIHQVSTGMIGTVNVQGIVGTTTTVATTSTTTTTRATTTTTTTVATTTSTTTTRPATTTTTTTASTTTTTMIIGPNNVDMGNMDPPCGSFGPNDIGFVDCTTNTGGILVAAITNISVGDTVTWTMRSTPHTTTSGNQPTAGACGTGDVWDSAVANAFTPGFVFMHTFNTPGTCIYFCIIHPTTMMGQVNVAGPVATTTTTVAQTTTTRAATTTTVAQTTTTVVATTTTRAATTTTVAQTTTTRAATTTTVAQTTTTRAATTTTVAQTTTTTRAATTTTTVAQTTTTTRAATTTTTVAQTTTTTRAATTTTVAQTTTTTRAATTTTTVAQTTTTTRAATTTTRVATTTTSRPATTTTTRVSTTTTTKPCKDNHGHKKHKKKGHGKGPKCDDRDDHHDNDDGHHDHDGH